jgi:L-amino acid N-acyltransferase YncA
LRACRAVALREGGLDVCFLLVLTIRPATVADHDAIWKIFHEIVAPGDTYAFDPQISREEALAYWLRLDTHTFVAENDGRVVGTYILKANQSGPGAHVANAACMVPAAARGKGIGRAMAEHCLNEARRLGFSAMQFNFVISTNESAIRLWQQLGFEIVGTLPGAFRHPQKGYVDVYVMFRSLDTA